MAEAVPLHVRRVFQAVVAAEDCAPGARALSKRFSRSCKLMGACARSAERGLGVHDPLERNVDVDSLSHPSQLRAVSRSVGSPGVSDRVSSGLSEGLVGAAGRSHLAVMTSDGKSS